MSNTLKGIMMVACCGLVFFGFVWVLIHLIGIIKTETKVISPQPVLVQEVDVPPDFLLIDSERWYVIPTDFKDNKQADSLTDGMTICSDRKIYYRPTSDKTRIRVILWHEILHASQCRPRSDDTTANWMPWGADPGHHRVYMQGMFLAEFALTNPGYMRWAANEQ